MDISKGTYLNAPSYNKVFQYIIKHLPSLRLAELKIILVIFRCTHFAAKGTIQISITDLQKLTGLSNKSIISGINDLESQEWIKVNRDESPFHYSLNRELILSELNKQTESGELIDSCINDCRIMEEVHLTRLGIPFEYHRIYHLWNFYCSPTLDLNNENHQKCVLELVDKDSYKHIFLNIVEIIKSSRVEHYHSDTEIMKIFGVTEQ